MEMSRLLSRTLLLLLLAGVCVSCLCQKGRRKSVVHKPLELVKVSGRPHWRYQVSAGRFPKSFTAGDTLGIGGEGIESASVTGRAKEEAFGGWRVKEVNWNHVLFEATCDARVEGTFGYFCVSAPQAKEGEVRWLWVGRARGGWGDKVPGPASVQ